ncbi:MAG TPA: HD domain-containing phosphohydrolase [Actinomycetota bacterium]|nr:HD domain-containing phosphohydrolase [Actinomycetota bacterium]
MPTTRRTETRLRLADMLAALSVTTDLGMGNPPEEAIRSCLIGTSLARRLGLPQADVADVYYTALLMHLGCTATAHEEARYFGGDELASRVPAQRADFGSAREALGTVLATGKGRGLRRPAAVVRAMAAGKAVTSGIFRAVCEVGARLAERLGMGPGVRAGVFQALERWDGKGAPAALAGEQISAASRIAQVSTQVALFAGQGVEVVVDMVRRRSGGWFDPRVAERFVADAAEILAEVEPADAWEAVLEAEPEPRRAIPEERLDDVALAFADFVDLKSPFTLRHSTGVADLAGGAARELGLRRGEVVRVRRAALLHDLGRVAVSAGIWDRPATLTTAQREQVRLHPYHTERILARSGALSPLARVAGMHHERVDGSGYHHGLDGAGLPRAARLLAAADTYRAMTEERPHRPPLPPGDAARELVTEADAGRLDGECVRAVLAAAGEPPPARTSWPAGLSDREVDVLRLLATGSTNREIGRALYISPRTAEHHVQHIYGKIGMSTRAGAALFAMEHDLIPG